ncbi:MAG: FeoB-associated Cys-rich membrane protein [Saccharofermentans sp.]|nr:FeoB-associated Cys-rich membrane protein [Saccharofermentans sp.]
MLEWLSNNWANILIIALVTALVVLAIISMVRDKKEGKSSCGCNCANCALAGKCHSVQKKEKS